LAAIAPTPFIPFLFCNKSIKDVSAIKVSCELKDKALHILKHEFVVGRPLHIVLQHSMVYCKLWLALDRKLAAAVLRQGQISAAKAPSSPDTLLDLIPQIYVSSSFEFGARPCSFFPLAKDWTLSCTATWFVVSSHLTSNQFGIGLATICMVQKSVTKRTLERRLERSRALPLSFWPER
jgi:hypothetical protein